MAEIMDESASFDKKHLYNLGKYQKSIEKLYEKFWDEAAKLGISTGFEPGDKGFSWDNFPKIRKKLTDLMWRMRQDVERIISSGVEDEFDLSAAKNSAMVAQLVKSTKLTEEQAKRMQPRNADAVKAFQERKVKGLGLSDRVWNLANQAESEIATAIDLSLSKGESADQLSRDVRKLLKEPNMMYRRYHEKIVLKDGRKKDVAFWRRKVVDEDGNVHWVKEELAHTGVGVYRSSYKNAMRMARTETNMAYHKADTNAWSSSQIVLGIEIRLSNNHTSDGKKLEDICDRFAGLRFPKQFDFTGWHPQCRCIAIPINPNPKEMMDYLKRMANGEDVSGYHFTGEVTKMPQEFLDWCAENQDRLVNMQSKGNLPYFIKNNIADGYTFDSGDSLEDAMRWKAHVPQPIPDTPDALLTNEELKAKRIAEAAERRHALRTPEREEELRKWWKEHRINDAHNRRVAERTPEYMEEFNKRAEERQRKLDIINKFMQGSMNTQVTEPWRGTYDTEIDACKTVKELVKLMNDKGVCKSASFGTMPIDNAKQICKALSDVQARYGLDPIDILWKSAGKTALMSANGGYVNLSPHYWGKDKGKALDDDYRVEMVDWLSSKKTSLKRHEDYIKIAEDKIKDPNTSEQNKNYYKRQLANWKKERDKLKNIIDAGYTSFGTYLSRETIARDCVIHELGHVLHDQLTGAINPEKNTTWGFSMPAKYLQKRIDAATAKALRNESEALYRKYKHKCGWLSYYGDSNSHEFIAEANVYYMLSPERLPQDVKDWFDKVEKLGCKLKGNKTKQKPLTFEEATKKYNEWKDRLEKKAQERHNARTDADIKKIKEAAQKRKKEHEEIKANASAIAQKANGLPWISASQIDELGKDKYKYHLQDLKTKAEELEKKVDEVENDIKDLEKTIPEVKKWAQQFTSDELHKVSDSVQNKIKSLEAKYASGAYDHSKYHTLNEYLAGKMDFEASWVAQNGASKFSTWEVAESAYADKSHYYHVEVKIDDLTPKLAALDALASKHGNKALSDLVDNANKSLAIKEVNDAEVLISTGQKMSDTLTQYEQLKGFSTTSGKFNNAMNEAESLLKKGDFAGAKVKLDEAENVKKINEASKASHAKAQAAAKAAKQAEENEQWEAAKLAWDAIKKGGTASKKSITSIDKAIADGDQKKVKKALLDKYGVDVTDSNNKYRIEAKQNTGALGHINDDAICVLAKSLKLNRYRQERDGKIKISTAERQVYEDMENAAIAKDVAKVNECLKKLGDDFSDPYGKSRKDAAIWSIDPKEGDSYLRPLVKDDWLNNFTDEEKKVMFLYTDGSSYLNEPLYTTYFGKKQDIVAYIKKYGYSKYNSPNYPTPGNEEYRDCWTDINILTGAIDKAKPIPADMWVNRGDSSGGFMGQFGVDLSQYVNNPKALVGMEGMQAPFMSTGHSKAYGFVGDGVNATARVVYNIYCPAGTKGVYTEPFSRYGNLGYKGIDWDGSNGPMRHEVEYLLQRGTKLRITKAEYKRGQWFIDMEVIEQPKKQPNVI